MERQTLSVMQACEVVGVCRRTIYNWIQRGKLEYMRTAGGSIRIFADTLWRNGDNSPIGTQVAEEATVPPDGLEDDGIVQ